MVAQDVTPYTMVHGDRAAVNGLNVVGLRRLGMKSEEMSAVKQMYNIVYDSKLTLDDAKAKILADVPESLYRAAWLNFLNRSTRGLCR
jgi:UDP-N-acetylglucosamine acyltransferase